jgi:hypothetical protein
MRYEWASDGYITCDDVPIAQISRSWFRERADLLVDGTELIFRAAGSERVAVTDDVVHCRARRTSFFSQAWAVTGQGGDYEVRPGGVFTTAVSVTCSGTEIGRIGSSGVFTMRPRLDIDPSVPTVDALFLMWIGFIIRSRRAHRSQSAGMSGG